ncbi:MAG: UDP-N-acetylmuramate--L-alanine ligase [Rickettsiales bacterium]|nr:UDP-N-acetylmuramate--L-alanine ligase [Rickettsiales bacterium]
MNCKNLKAKITGKVHFIGLGGIGMSALALILNKIDILVQGSDLSENYMTPILREKGIAYFVGHEAKNITDDISLIVETSIIKPNNPEVIEAQAKGIPVITRAELLAMVMSEHIGITVAGTHGKTSTTAMTSLMLEIADFDPTIINGGIMNYFQSNSKIGNGKYLVAESDESDGSFVNLPTFIGAVTNIEPEHLEFYSQDFEKQKSYFERYITQIPQEGLCVLCIDDPEIEKIYNKIKASHKNLVTYSIKKAADLSASNIRSDTRGITFDIKFAKSNREIKDLHMSVYGLHNASNALVAIAIADFLKVSDDKIKEALASFSGVKRRFTKTGEVDGVTIIDDYGHHPTEIVATLKAARQLVGGHQVILVLQPHKYSRVRDLFAEFCHCADVADIAIIANIYSAGQQPIADITQDNLIEGMKKAGHKNVLKLNSELDLAALIKANAKAGDIVLVSGAGTSTYWANKLPEQLQNLK